MGKKTKSRKVKTSKNLKNKGGRPKDPIITPQVEVFIFQQRASGKTLKQTVGGIKDNFKKNISISSVHEYLGRYPERYKEFLADVKAIRLANATARILELQEIANKLKELIMDGAKKFTPRQWAQGDINGMVRELKGLYEQIARDAGDRPRNGDKKDSAQVIQIFNHLPGVLADATKSSTDQNKRF